MLEVEDVRVKGLDRLADLRGRLCFQCTRDAQSTMPSADPSRIEAEAEAIVHELAALEGGLIASIYLDPASCGVPEAVQSFGVDAFRRACERFLNARDGAAPRRVSRSDTCVSTSTPLPSYRR